MKKTSLMVLDGVTSFLCLKDVKITCKRMRRSLSICGSSSVQWRKVGRSWRLRMCFRRLLCVRIEIDQLQCVICWVIIHCLSVSCTKINHSRCTLVIWSSLQLTSKQWIIKQQFTAGAYLFLKIYLPKQTFWIQLSPKPKTTKPQQLIPARGLLNNILRKRKWLFCVEALNHSNLLHTHFVGFVMSWLIFTLCNYSAKLNSKFSSREVYRWIYGRKFSFTMTPKRRYKTWFPNVYPSIYLTKWKFWIWLSPF